MSDTSCPPDAFYVSNSLIKQHPRERDRGGVKSVRAARVCITWWCLNCQVRFCDSDLHTTRFNRASCSAIYRFLLWQSTRFLSGGKRWAVFFFFSSSSFCRALNIKRVKSTKWNSLQWGVLPAKEWGGVRIQNDCRSALLENNSVIYFSQWNVICGSVYPFNIFCSECFCQIVQLALCFILSQIQKNIIANLLITVFFKHLPRGFLISPRGYSTTVEHFNGNLQLPFVSTSLLCACFCRRLACV